MRDAEIQKIITIDAATPSKNQVLYTYHDLLKIKVQIIKDLIEQPEMILSSLDIEVDELYPGEESCLVA